MPHREQNHAGSAPRAIVRLTTAPSPPEPRPEDRRTCSQDTARRWRLQSRCHSAHVGQEVEVHYRWHALYGRRVRRQYLERCVGGEVVHVEVAPGVVIVVAAWMLDPAACAGMVLGTPRVTISTLAELHQLLVEHGFRRSSPGGPMTIREEQNENRAVIGAVIDSPAPAQHPVRSRKATRDDRKHSLRTAGNEHQAGRLDPGSLSSSKVAA